ncbi:unnamed protein product [Moneuplotes crassus]|uniref:Uncharacterized protein n=1 Tax=Euplotes crassus TaxID=5936 RepID=A0AAD1UPP9_EUPCR|nr:unnamed protein product [Moneuplotes crassus]
MSSEVSQLWKDYESGRTFIINPSKKPSQQECLANGTFQAKFHSQISGKGDRETRKLFENKDYLCNSVKNRMGNIYTPSLSKLEGYTQYPRPKTKQTSRKIYKQRNYTGRYSRVKSVRHFPEEIPSYLDTNWFAPKQRAGTAKHNARRTVLNNDKPAINRERNLKVVSYRDRVKSAHRKNSKIKGDEPKTLAYYQNLRKVNSRKNNVFISASTNVQKTLRTMRPTKIDPAEDDLAEVMEVKKPKKPQKAKPKAKGKKEEVVEDTPEESSKDRTIDALNDPSISDMSVASIQDADYISEKLRQRTSSLMKKKLDEFHKAETLVKEYKPPKFKRSSKPKSVFLKVPIKTSGQQWRSDRRNMMSVNPSYYSQEVSQINKDKAMLLKRRDGTVMKNLAMQQELEITSKKADKELRRAIYLHEN